MTIVAATLGALVGGILWRGGSLDNLLFLPFTLVGTVAVLLPTYLWARRAKGLSQAASYAAVLVAGVLGSFLILLAFILSMGGITAEAPPLELFLVGSLFGGVTAIAWVSSHYLTKPKHV